jgi:predicted nucleic acid-binding protein
VVVSVFLDLPQGARVTVDTAPIIYLLEGNVRFLPRFMPLFERIDEGSLQGVISAVTLAEVLAGPLKRGNEILADRYYQALAGSRQWQLLPVDGALAFTAARIRVGYGLKLPDALQVATAVRSGSTALVTHDRDFSRVDEIRILGGAA